jgi:hypothetical protein
MVRLWRRLRRKCIPLSELKTADIMAVKSSLEKSVDSLEIFTHVFTALVAVGLIVEYRDPFLNFIKTHDWRFISGSIGGVLVTVGVAGELLSGFRSTAKDGDLREANSILAFRATQLLAASNERIAELNLIAEQARTELAELELQVQQLTQSNLQHQMKISSLEETRKPRTISPQQQSLIADALAPLNGSAVEVRIYAREAEANMFAMQVSDALSAAGLNVSVDNIMDHAGVGFAIAIHANDDIPPLAASIAAAFTRGGVNLGFAINPSIVSPHQFLVFVGAKPVVSN